MDKNLSNLDDKRYSFRFLIIVSIFITCLITANIIAVKVVNIFGLILPAAVFIFPLSYIIGDVLTEVYGYKNARKVIWLGFFCNLLTVGAIWMGGLLPAASFWDGQSAYEKILGFTPRLLFASFIAYLIGEFINSYVLAKLKILTKGRFLWLRTIGSTVVGQGLDSFIFISLAFIGIIPSNALIWMIITQWLVKSAYEAVITPLTYIVINYLKKKENIDTYDYNTRFNPLLFSE